MTEIGHGRDAPIGDIYQDVLGYAIGETTVGVQMDLIAERVLGKELREIRHKAKYDTTVVFEDGAITAWTEVKINITFGDDPVIVKDVKCSDEWYTILFNEGDIQVSRIPIPPRPECFIYGVAGQPASVIVDRGEE